MHFLHKTFPGTIDKISHCAKFHNFSCLVSWLPKARSYSLANWETTFFSPHLALLNKGFTVHKFVYMADTSQTTVCYAWHVFGLCFLISLAKRKQSPQCSSPLMCHVSLKFCVLVNWDDLVDLGSVSTRPRTSQVMNNKEASCMSLTAVFVTFIMSTIYFLCVHLIQRRSCDKCW